MEETLIADKNNLRTEVIRGLESRLGTPLPFYVRRKQIAELGFRGEASLAKDACEQAGRAGELLPDGMLGGCAVYRIDRLIDYALSAHTTRKGRRPGTTAHTEGE